MHFGRSFVYKHFKNYFNTISNVIQSGLKSYIVQLSNVCQDVHLESCLHFTSSPGNVKSSAFFWSTNFHELKVFLFYFNPKTFHATSPFSDRIYSISPCYCCTFHGKWFSFYSPVCAMIRN